MASSTAKNIEQEIHSDLLQLMGDCLPAVSPVQIPRRDYRGNLVGGPKFAIAVPQGPTYALLCKLDDCVDPDISHRNEIGRNGKIGFGQAQVTVKQFAATFEKEGRVSAALGFRSANEMLGAFQVSAAFETAQDYLKIHIAEADYARGLAEMDHTHAKQLQDASAMERSAAWADKFAHDIRVWSKMQPIMARAEDAFLDVARRGLIDQTMAKAIVGVAAQYTKDHPDLADWAAPASGILLAMEMTANGLMKTNRNIPAVNRFAQTIAGLKSEYEAAKHPEQSAAPTQEAALQTRRESVLSFLGAPNISEQLTFARS